jgi:hypothetical protein
MGGHAALTDVLCNTLSALPDDAVVHILCYLTMDDWAAAWDAGAVTGRTFLFMAKAHPSSPAAEFIRAVKDWHALLPKGPFKTRFGRFARFIPVLGTSPADQYKLYWDFASVSSFAAFLAMDVRGAIPYALRVHVCGERHFARLVELMLRRPDLHVVVSCTVKRQDSATAHRRADPWPGAIALRPLDVQFDEMWMNYPTKKGRELRRLREKPCGKQWPLAALAVKLYG